MASCQLFLCSAVLGVEMRGRECSGTSFPRMRCSNSSSSCVVGVGDDRWRDPISRSDEPANIINRHYKVLICEFEMKLNWVV
jgi:hypothetical protein